MRLLLKTCVCLFVLYTGLQLGMHAPLETLCDKEARAVSFAKPEDVQILHRVYWSHSGSLFVIKRYVRVGPFQMTKIGGGCVFRNGKFTVVRSRPIQFINPNVYRRY